MTTTASSPTGSATTSSPRSPRPPAATTRSASWSAPSAPAPGPGCCSPPCRSACRGAVATIGYPFYTNLLQSRIQARLDRQLQSEELKQDYLDRNVSVGDSLTRLKIPELDVNVVVVEGTTASALRAGAGHYPETPLPCELGNVAIAGHRTTYGRPFHDMDLLEQGDVITLETPIGDCTYEITEKPFVVSPKQIDVVSNTPNRATLTLTTCHPKGSAKQRLVLHAELVSSSVRDS